jgi:transposase
MEPSTDLLYQKVMKEFPVHKVSVVYECGCFGYWAYRNFLEFGWECLVVNPGDIPRRNKQKYQKTDTIDARNLSRLLKAGLLQSVHVLDIKREQLRSLFRRRNALVEYNRSIKVRVKASLLYFGLKIPKELDNANWTYKFKDWIRSIQWHYTTGKSMIDSSMRQIDFLHHEINNISTELRSYCRKNYSSYYNLLKSVPGVGPLTAICFIAEIGDISRFNNFKQLASLVGLMPSIYQSADTNKTQGLTPRCLRLMRSYLVEAVWQAVRIDPVMQSYYKSHVGKKPNDIIVKVARKLLSRMHAVLRTKTTYEIGLIK